VHTDGNQTMVEAPDPQIMVTVAGHPDLTPIAYDATRRLTAALDTLRR
jgi:hypothetical protein